MKYMLMLARCDEEWEALTDEERDYPTIMRWFGDLAQRGVLDYGGAELQAGRTATTVSWERDRAILTDGPFVEAKETIGGFCILEVPDLDAALDIARSWPARSHKVEIRPIVQH